MRRTTAASRVPDHVFGLWYIAAAVSYPIAILLAERRYGVTGLLVALAACLVIQIGVIDTTERRRRRRASLRDEE
jgi:hypothetical protein